MNLIKIALWIFIYLSFEGKTRDGNVKAKHSWEGKWWFYVLVIHLFLLYWLCQSLDCGHHNKLWKILQEMGIPDHLTCLLRNLYAGQEATVRTWHGTTDWFQIGKGVRQGCILSSCLFNFYAEYIMRNAGLEEAQAGIQIARININNLRYGIPPLWQKVKRN